ncbi:MAG: hypothetical protein OXI79_03685 [Gammaproteobacteria bacterium]|nr:hypothetical protein [Gammaproteobacteria bacterium]
MGRRAQAAVPADDKALDPAPSPGTAALTSPGVGESGAAADSRAVREVLGNARRLLRLLDAGPAYRNDWEYRFAALGAVLWPEGLDRRHLAGMPLAKHTRNCLRDADLWSGTAALTTRDLLLPKVGKRTYRDLLVGIGRFLEALVEDPAACVPAATSPELAELARRVETGQWTPMEPARSNAALGTAVAILRARLDGVVAAMSPAQRFVAGCRLLEEPRPTLVDIGRRLGVTGSRAQQIQAGVERNARRAFELEGPLAAAILRNRLGHVVEENAMRRRLDAAVGGDHGVAGRLLRKGLLERMGFVLAAGAYLNDEAVALIGTIRAGARDRADDAGLVEESELLALLPEGDWRRHWPVLWRRAGLHAMHGRLAIRRDVGARVKAALLSIGRPATREEIAGVCGLTPAATGRRLWRLPSVVRATKRHWALADWVGQEFRGIAEEIVARIREDGGATTTERLLEELPSRFGVTESSVRTFVKTRRFVVRRGRVRLADPRSVKLRPLAAAAHGRDADGALYWTFRVRPQNLEGYSVTGVPAEFAKALGCEPDGRALAAIDNLPECRELSVRWRLTSTTGASLGYVAGPLRALGVGAGETVRVVVKGAGRVRLDAVGEQG